MYHSGPLPLGGVTTVIKDFVAVSSVEGGRVYVRKLPFFVTENELKDFFFDGFST
jgi:RNA recognition motif-containing protein